MVFSEVNCRANAAWTTPPSPGIMNQQFSEEWLFQNRLTRPIVYNIFVFFRRCQYTTVSHTQWQAIYLNKRHRQQCCLMGCSNSKLCCCFMCSLGTVCQLAIHLSMCPYKDILFQIISWKVFSCQFEIQAILGIEISFQWGSLLYGVKGSSIMLIKDTDFVLLGVVHFGMSYGVQFC